MKNSSLRRSLRHPLFQEWPLLLVYGTMGLFLIYSNVWIPEVPGLAARGCFILWIFVAILFSSFAIVRHADVLADELGEPYGTLILTLSMTGIEVMMISAMMLQENNPTLPRDTMFSVIMIVLGGIFGYCLLAGGFKFHEQQFNLKGGKSFLGLILPLSVLALVMPSVTPSGSIGFFSPLHAITMVILSLTIYGIFLVVQTHWYREFFLEEPLFLVEENTAELALPFEKKAPRVFFHSFFLLVYIFPIVLLSKKLAFLLEMKRHGMPHILPEATRGALHGLVVAILILAPEGLAAIEAARKNHMQRSINLLFGSVLSTIGLTVPAALAIGLFIGQPVHLGLEPASVTLLAVTLGSCILTFSQSQTNVLQGCVHLLLFGVYILLMFQ
ncbi:MAG: calcium:proton antiporter [Chthoniobacterales bacterium]